MADNVYGAAQMLNLRASMVPRPNAWWQPEIQRRQTTTTSVTPSQLLGPRTTTPKVAMENTMSFLRANPALVQPITQVAKQMPGPQADTAYAIAKDPSNLIRGKKTLGNQQQQLSTLLNSGNWEGKDTMGS